VPSAAELADAFRRIGITRDYAGLDLTMPVDLQGWGSTATIFESVITEVRPDVVIEVGTWKGASLLHMDKVAQHIGLETAFIAVDTWLGSNDSLWLTDDRRLLNLNGGYPSLFPQFVANVVAHGAADRVFPLPMTSSTAARVLAALNVTADAVYLDAGHDYEDVAADLKLYWPLVRDGGVLFGDDYDHRWPGVVKAVNRFRLRHLSRLELHDATKWLIRKR
jgi:predicted O-methyltransferase YrrM